MTGGCATVFNRHADNMDLTSEPTGAFVTLDEGTITCTTPCHLQFAEKKKIIPGTIKKHGYKSQEITVRRPIHWGFWVNLALGVFGLPGLAIDWISGSMRGYVNLHVRLEEGEDDKSEQQPATTDIHVLLPPLAPLHPAAPSNAALARMREKYPEAFVLETLRTYYGALEQEKEGEIMGGIYQQLLGMEKMGERIDLDEAIHRQMEGVTPP